MRAQCVLVATTLLQSGANFHSFLYTGSKTVRVNMEPCYGGMSTRLKQRAVTEFLTRKLIIFFRWLMTLKRLNTIKECTMRQYSRRVGDVLSKIIQKSERRK